LLSVTTVPVGTAVIRWVAISVWIWVTMRCLRKALLLILRRCPGLVRGRGRSTHGTNTGHEEGCGSMCHLAALMIPSISWKKLRDFWILHCRIECWPTGHLGRHKQSNLRDSSGRITLVVEAPVTLVDVLTLRQMIQVSLLGVWLLAGQTVSEHLWE